MSFSGCLAKIHLFVVQHCLCLEMKLLFTNKNEYRLYRGLYSKLFEMNKHRVEENHKIISFIICVTDIVILE
jgi:hypothetical protein